MYQLTPGKMKTMCSSTKITPPLFCFDFLLASLTFPLQLCISSIFLQQVFHFHTQYFSHSISSPLSPLSQMIVSNIAALLRSKASCSTCSSSVLIRAADGWWLLLPVNVSLNNQHFPLQHRNYNSGQNVSHFWLLEFCQTYMFWWSSRQTFSVTLAPGKINIKHKKKLVRITTV